MTTTPLGQRAACYWFVDGLPEIVFSLNLLLFGGLVFSAKYVTHPLGAILFVLFVCGFGLFIWKYNAILLYLKSRITYPRTGYVQPPKELERQENLTILALQPAQLGDGNVTYFRKSLLNQVIMIFVSTCDFSDHSSPQRWVVPVKILALAGVVYGTSQYPERPFPWWSAALLALTGLPFFWLDISNHLQAVFPFLLTGLWLLAQGLWRLVSYLRENPLPRTTAEDMLA